MKIRPSQVCEFENTTIQTLEIESDPLDSPIAGTFAAEEHLFSVSLYVFPILQFFSNIIPFSYIYDN